MNLKDFIRSIPDYPKKGILFRDITTLINNEKAFEETINQIIERSKDYKIDKIAAILSNLNFFDLSTIWLIVSVKASASFINVVISLNNIPFFG